MVLMNLPAFNRITAAFTAVYSDYYALVYSVIFSKLNNADEAEDICQEVFMRLYERFAEVREPRKWLYGAMRLVMLEHFRKKRGADVNIDDLLDDVSMGYVNGFREARIIIRQALNDMNNYENAEDRIAFELIAVHNFTYREAAEQMGITEHKIRYKYNRVSERLLAYLRARGVKGLEDLL